MIKNTSISLSIISLSIMCGLLSCNSNENASRETTEDTVTYEVGFRVMSFIDSSRNYRPDVGQGDKLRFRPVDVDIWYPAQPDGQDSTLRLGYFLQSFQDRANFLGSPQTFESLRMDIARSFSEGFGCSQPDSILNYSTDTFYQKKKAVGKFPLILYLSSYNSMGYENYLLFESLVRQGYMVASISSIGQYPGDMTMKYTDLMEQVWDASQTLERMKKSGTIDTTKIGLLGYSWGGLAGAVLAMERRDIGAIVSLDGSEFHHYGYDKSEDKDFDETVNTPSFKKNTVSASYLRLESNPNPGASSKDSVYNFLPKIINSKRVVKIDSASHQDFSSLPTAVNLSGNCPTRDIYRTISELTISHFDRYLKMARKP